MTRDMENRFIYRQQVLQVEIELRELGSLVGIGHQPCMRKEIVLLIICALTNLLMNWLMIHVFMVELSDQ